jgi:hypothetical protein
MPNDKPVPVWQTILFYIALFLLIGFVSTLFKQDRNPVDDDTMAPDTAPLRGD